VAGFWSIVLAVVLTLLIWSSLAARALCRRWVWLLSTTVFAALDLGVLGLILISAPQLEAAVGRGGVFAIALFIVFQLGFNILVTLAAVGTFIWRRVKGVPYDESRRTFLKCGAAYPAAAAGLALYGGLWEREDTVVRELDIPAERLTVPEGYRIAQLSDIHLGPFFSLTDFKALLTQTANLRPEVLVITGDLFDSEAMNEEAARLLDSFVPAFPEGIFFVLGNHEYFRNARRIERYLRATRVTLLEDTAAVTQAGLCVAGVSYPTIRKDFDRERLLRHRRAMAACSAGLTTVLLAHHPDCIDDGAASGVLLTLTGHTHGGQFGILGVPIFPAFSHTRGLVQTGECYGYVHSGNGSWFPCRIGCPPEIAVFRLVKK